MRLTNNYEHAGDNRFMVYEYYLEEHADEFEQMLQVEGIVFERFKEEEDDDAPHLFGIEKTYKKQATWCNNMMHAKYRNPMIPNVYLRWALLVITTVAITFAIVGYLKAK
jgi:hypothetical protein